MSFLNLKSVFDMVPKLQLWKSLTEFNVDTKLKTVIQSLYKHVYGLVRINGATSKLFHMKRGIKEEDSLSPLLFTVFMDSVLKHCNRRTPKVKISNWKLRPVYVQTLVYADDVVLIANTERDLQVSVTEWASTFSKRGFEVNIHKSKVKKICRINEEEEINIQWKQQKLDIIEEISYLGVVICSNGKIDAEMNNRISKANQI
jgi:hypothetical protein